ncbi:hypothetical protein GCM10025859_40770 [Alicyclobacillus fastidiosus]|nr:hypothetical protein GCM10025859_40770 [Alicyclobacillus fastidiosus]
MLAYVLIGAMMYFVMTSLGEMATFLPVAGSVETYATRYVDPAFGFALGWNYWYNWATTLAAELAAGAIVMKYWFPHSSSVMWSILFLCLLLLLNIVSVRGYGEGEFWFASVKVLTIVAFLVVGILMIFGVMSGRTDVGFHNFALGGSPFHGGAMSIFSIFLVSFS